MVTNCVIFLSWLQAVRYSEMSVSLGHKVLTMERVSRWQGENSPMAASEGICWLGNGFQELVLVQHTTSEGDMILFLLELCVLL